MIDGIPTLLRRRAALGGLVLSVLGAACGGERATSPVNQGTSTLAVAPGDPQAQGTVQGQVLGRDEAGNPTEAVADARVWVWHLVPDPSAPPDTVLLKKDLVGNLLTGADGRFRLTDVPEGQYELAAIPPADSPFFPAQDFQMTAPGTGAIDATLVLGRGRVPGASDLQGVVQAIDDVTHEAAAVAGADVRVYALSVSSSDPGAYDRRLVGSATTDAAGAFSFNDIAEGQFLLWSVDVTPPTGSPYQPVEDLMVRATDTGLTTLTIELHR